MKYSVTISLLLSAFLTSLTFSQSKTVTAEDSLATSPHATTVGGYGNAVYTRDANAESAEMNLERVVLFVGHSFNATTSVFTELEVEDAKVSGGDPGGEVAFEQAYVKFDLTPHHYITAGLFLPRIGILNENHLPTSFNGNERTQVETYILPSTWREIGVGFYGSLASTPLNYSVAITNGLDAGGFASGSGIREGRFEGREASASNLALSGSVQYYIGTLKLQGSGYYGGTIGLPSRQADSLQLQSGPFGTPVGIVEADAVYESGRVQVRVLGTIVTIPKAYDINRAFANNTPDREYGAYCEAAYNLLEPTTGGADLFVFGRFEALDMNDQIPANGIMDGTLHQSHIITGLTYHPSPNVAVKADIHFVHTGEVNPGLLVNPNPFSPVYNQNNSLVTLGIAYSF